MSFRSLRRRQPGPSDDAPPPSGPTSDTGGAAPAPPDVVSTQRRQMLLIRAQLGERLQALRLLQLEVDRSPSTNRDRIDVQGLKAAVQHLEATITALTRAGSG